MFDRSANSTPFTRDLLNAHAMTHQYANNAKKISPINCIVMYKGIYTHSLSHETKFNYKDITAKEPEKEKHDTGSNDYATIRKLVKGNDAGVNQIS